MIFTDHQMMMFKSRALWLLSKLREWEKHDNETKAGFVVADFQEVCSIGYSIAQDEVCSTPWEYHLVGMPVDDGQARGCGMHLNVMGELGWEPFMACGSWLILRRRKAVSEIVAAQKESE